MTSKDELRLQVGHKLHDYGVRGQDNDYLTDYILNLLEGEKQKLLERVDKEVIGENEFEDKNVLWSYPWKRNQLRAKQRQRLATLNKEPNKGEDVDG